MSDRVETIQKKLNLFKFQTMNKKIFFLSVLTMLSAWSLNAQVQLVKDVNTAAAVNGSSPGGFVSIGSTIYFSASDGSNGGELWKSDGTPGGTVMVKDINPGATGSGPSYMVNLNGTLFFAASDGNSGTELWKSDGTAAGTVLVKDIYPGTAGSNVYGIVAMNGAVYFQASDGVNGTELWKSDGTLGGTVLVKDINPGSASSNPYLTAIGNTLYMSVNDGTTGYELWKSDGSGLGTSLIKDIRPGATGSSPQSFVLLGSTVYFIANDGTTGQELWKTNGTGIGTSLVKDIYPGANGSLLFYNLVKYNSLLAFTAYNGTNGSELWTSDGTAVGTTMVTDINAGAADGAVGTPVISNGILFFAATTAAAGSELWISDGTSGGTGLVKDIYPGATGSSIYIYGLTDINGTLYFSADNGVNENELWRSDGTVGGTVMVKDINPGALQSFPNYFIAGSSFLLFQADNGSNGAELWKSDGSTGGTVMLKNIWPDVSDSNIDDIVASGSNVFFTAYEAATGMELWKSDGTTVGTAVVKDIYSGINSGSPQWITAVGNKVYFPANDGVNGYEFWVSDGTFGGTSLVKDIVAGAGSGSPDVLININDTVYFYANKAPEGNELWKSDGTSGGTVLVKDIATTAGWSSLWSGEMKNMNGKLYLAAQTQANGAEPWISNGTSANTLLVKDVDVTCAGCGSDVNNFTYSNGLTFFCADDGVNGYELWKTNGTTAGTSLVKDIKPGAAGGMISYFTNYCMSSCSFDMISANNILFFIADDGTGSGAELWKSDGTSGGTVMVKDINPGSLGSSPYNFINIGGTLYFTASDGVNGNELWKSDGTSGGTVMVKDINPGSAGSSPSGLTNFGGKLFFSAADGLSGSELWTSMGTSSTTAKVSDIYPGAGSSSPSLLTADGNTLFFTANDGVIGTELYKLDMPATLASVGTQTNVSCNGFSNGSIDLSVSGGTQPYTFAWSNLATTEDVSGLTAGVYSVTVSDAWGWTSVSSFTVTEPNTLSVPTFTVTNATCFGDNNGSIAVTVTGGTPTYVYNWSGGPTNLSAGTYSVLITDSKGCTTTFSATVAQPPALSGSTQVNDASCFGSTNGNATVNMSVGQSPFGYQWDVNAGSQTTQMATNLAMGTYSVLVTDDDGCTKSFTVTVNQPSALSMSVTSAPDTCGLNTGSASVTNQTGGTPTYSYTWSGGGTNPTKNNLASGTHTVTLTDSKGCVLTGTVSVASVAHEPIPICLATVDSLSINNIIYWDKTTYASVDSFIIYREVSTNTYLRIGAVSMDSLSQFEDDNRAVGPANGDPKVGSYRYKLQIRDVCGNYSALSPYHNTVFFLDNQNGSFTWNSYLVEGQGSTPVVNFNLLRDTLVNGNWQVIGVVAGTQTTLNDPNYFSYQNTADWRVEATGFNCSPTLKYGANSIMGAIIKSKSNITNNRTTAIYNGAMKEDITIYPNPGTGLFTVEMRSAAAQLIQVYDATGKLVYSNKVNSEKQLVDLSSLQQGVYNMVISGTKVLTNKKLVILK